jgi:hypothetical protein
MTADLLKAWRGGSDLAEAWFHLAPLEQWARFDYPEATRRRSKETAEWNESDWIDADADDRSDLQKALSAQFQIRSPSASRAAQVEMKSWLLSELRRGAFVGVGRNADAEDKSGLETVPSFLFDPRHVDWERSTLRGRNRSFAEIRVVVAEAVTAVPDVPAYKAIGRPSKSDQVMLAIEGMIAEGVDFNSIGRGEAEQKILTYAKATLGADTRKGFSTPVVRRALVARCGKLFG